MSMCPTCPSCLCHDRLTTSGWPLAPPHHDLPHRSIISDITPIFWQLARDTRALIIATGQQGNSKEISGSERGVVDCLCPITYITVRVKVRLRIDGGNVTVQHFRCRCRFDVESLYLWASHPIHSLDIDVSEQSGCEPSRKPRNH